MPSASMRVGGGASNAARDPLLPDEYRLLILLRGTIVAFNQANQTGNYTVLRDLGTPAFQVANNPAKLAEIFAPLRARKVDLSPVLFANPKLFAPPAVQDGQVLRLTGFFPTAPEQVNFDLAFQLASDQWTLSGIAISTGPVSDASRSAQATYSLQAPASSAHRSAAAETSLLSHEARPSAGDAKPIRIDLSEPASLPPRRSQAEKKPAKPAAAQQAAAPPPPPQSLPSLSQSTPAPSPDAGDDASSNSRSPADQWQPR